MKKIAILGSTGSIGKNALEVIRQNEELQVVSLSANGNVDLLLEQILEFRPKLVCVYKKEKAEELKKRLKERGIFHTEVLSGMDGLIAVSTVSEADIVLTAVVGMIGMLPTIAAMKCKKDIALANKETLVCAGHIIMPLAKETGVKIFPVDSEHSAIFQCLNGEEENAVRRIFLTASGGPFLHKSFDELKNVSVEEALKHPNWSMGAKITIDSSTMVNKGLEVCEAKWLFDLSPDQIEVVIHPQSILHSAVEFADGGVIGQFGLPDMKLPISYAFTYPKRAFVSNPYLDLFELKKLEFFKPDLVKFKGLKLAFMVVREGGSLPTVYNAANEVAVSKFLKRKIQYLDIVSLIEEEIHRHRKIEMPTVNDILQIQEDIFGRYQD